MSEKKYTGSCYIGVVGPSMEYGAANDSINNIARRSGDTFPVKIRATKGYDARQMHFNKWIYETNHPFMLLLDHDMVFPPDTLERLRSHEIPYVSGYYLRRRWNPVLPVHFDPQEHPYQWPMRPSIDVPERGKLIELGAGGWGCILVHREVALAMRDNVLKGEDWVIEDDMDIYPYDLEKLVFSLQGLEKIMKLNRQKGLSLKNGLPRFAFEFHVNTLIEELRILRGSKDPVGSDLRFPFYAREAGYKLMLDPEVRVAHITNYELSPDDYDMAAAEQNKAEKTLTSIEMK
jgi:hypothetical protein